MTPTPDRPEPVEEGRSGNSSWPALPLDRYAPTRDTLHRWTQMVGKTRMGLSAPVNHWWHSTLYVTASGLTTSLIPVGTRGLQIDFDFLDSELRLRDTSGRHAVIALQPRSVADFWAEYRARLSELDVDVQINPVPNEVADAIPFPDDSEHHDYDPLAAREIWLALVQAHRVLNTFRGRFRGKASSVHFFWGAFDLAVTRFSGRPAPRHPGGIPSCPDRVMWEAYSDEVSSAGFWPGGGGEGLFYSYAYPEPPGFRSDTVEPAEASFDTGLSEFVLPYRAVRTAAEPDAMLGTFLESTFDLAARHARWPADLAR